VFEQQAPSGSVRLQDGLMKSLGTS
jgi:hypothetical protein